MKPTPGKQYTVQDENSLSQIASRAYGDPTYWRRIWNANQNILRSGDPDLIFPGEVILIPILPERILPDNGTVNKDRDSIFVDLDGYEFRPKSARLLRTLDTVANGFQVTIPWQLGDDLELDKRVAPYKYTPAKVSIGSERIVTGVLYSVQPVIGNGITLNLSGATATADLVDSSLKPPYEFNDITFEDLVNKIVKPRGYNVIFDADTGGKFDRVTASKGQRVFDYLSGLAKQREVLLSCNTLTDLVVLQAKTTGEPISTLEEGKTLGVTGWGANFDGRKRFNIVRATGQTPSSIAEAFATDERVPRTRFKDVSANESEAGNLQAVAEWDRNKTLADALSFSLTVEGYYDQRGQLWEENTLVTVISKSMFLPDGFDFLINRVEYVLDGNGRSTILSFVPPTVYSRGDIVEPW